jgi:FecR protein
MKPTMNFSRFIGCLLVVAAWNMLPSPLASGATVDFVKGKASAPQGSSLEEGDVFATQAKSQSQVSGNGSYFRVGSDSQVNLGSGRRIALEKGVMLVGSEPGARRQTVEVTAPGYRLKVKGTAQIAYYPGQYVKIIVLEGTVTVALQSLAGEFETLEPGQMLIINPSDKRLPEPVEVDLTRLIATSQLINASFGAPSTQDLMSAAASIQVNDYRVGDIVRTPFALRGAAPP